ncbi:hypothetical protein KKB44_03555 [Candidatus Micrarchaeota archaeon]|nr:hypothetical protein [Candidatus Micrarchaeota archaeon]
MSSVGVMYSKLSRLQSRNISRHLVHTFFDNVDISSLSLAKSISYRLRMPILELLPRFEEAIPHIPPKKPELAFPLPNIGSNSRLEHILNTKFSRCDAAGNDIARNVVLRLVARTLDNYVRLQAKPDFAEGFWQFARESCNWKDCDATVHPIYQDAVTRLFVAFSEEHIIDQALALVDRYSDSRMIDPGSISPHEWFGRIPDVFGVIPVTSKLIARSFYPNGSSLEKANMILAIEDVAKVRKEKLGEVMRYHPEPFRISRIVKINGSEAFVGSPMHFSQYDAIPVYVRANGDELRLTFAYKSKSQDCWRRFAGYLRGIFWKGSSEHLQNFHWRIQKALDYVYENERHTDITMGSSKPIDITEAICPAAVQREPRLTETALKIILHSEDVLQTQMSLGSVPLNAEQERTETRMELVDYWWGGSIEGPYGRYMNLIVRSSNYLYCMALTEADLFLKYAEHRNEGGINSAGAPLRGVPVPKSERWLFTPAVEYDGQEKEAVYENPRISVHGTIAIGGGNRVRVNGIHNTEKSPFFKLKNGLSDVSRLLWSEKFDDAERKLRGIMETGGDLPLIETPPNLPPKEVLDEDAEQRHIQLISAFERYFSYHTHPDWEQKKRNVIAQYAITESEFALFKRYAEWAKGWKTYAVSYGDLDQWTRATIETRLEKLAMKWAEIMSSPTILHTRP